MENKKLQVYDPPMCCSTGICGPDVNPELINFAGTLDWLKKQGIVVERFNPSTNPGAFYDNKAVNDALKQHGNECLPLILVDGAVVSRGVYPSKKALAEFAGLDYKDDVEPDISKSTTKSETQDSEAVCGPECNCSKPPANNKMKITVGLVIVLVAIGIFAYKLTKSTPISKTAVSPNTYAAATDETTTKIASPPAEQPNVPIVQSNQTPKKMYYVGEYLESINSLNTVAVDQDAVFILVPAKEKESVKKETETAMLGTQRTLKTSNVKVGLYTLRTSASDYASISSQIKPPAILVACKGRGMNAVQVEDITETKLLQAFLAVSQAGGCGTGSTCGPGNSGCSDRRFKNNISPIETPLDKVLKLNGVTFTWDREKFPLRLFPEGRKIGLIAQEVESVIPEVVNTDNDGYKSVEYDKLVALLIEGVKEMKQQIQKQEAVIQEQGKRIKELEADVK